MSAVAAIRRIRAIAAREVRSAFVGPTAWIVLALSGLVAAGSFFGATFDDGQPASLRTVMLAAGWALLATAPALSMRSLSEEFRLKSWETLFAAPVGAGQIVAGKALAAAVLVAATLVPVAALAVPLEVYAAPDYGEIACGLLGLFLAGFAAACMGIAVSSTTSSQAVAFLGAFFAWLALVAGSRILVGVLPVEHAPIAAALDPLRRLEGFSLGLFDSAGVAFFAAIAATALAVAVVSLERVRDHTGPTRLSRLFAAGEGVAFALGTLLASAAAVGLLSQPALRVEFDATKTRAYSLAPSTVDLLAGLEGDWKVLLFVDAREGDPAVLRQIDEVLERFREANGRIDARRIDPADPEGAGAFEEALSSLVSGSSGDMARTEQAVQRGVAAFDLLRAESAGQPAGLRAAAQQLPADSPVRRTLEQMAGMFAQIATDGEQFRTRVVELARSSASRPLPDLAGARSALAAGFRTWGDQIASAASRFEEWRQQGSLPAPVRGVLGSRIKPYEELAERLLAARQELEALPGLDTDALGTELMQGEAAVVAGNGRIAVIPKWRIFPRAVAARGEDLVSYSWGFRGEEVLMGAIRGIAGGLMPEVVFMHAEKDSLLKSRQDNSDLVAVADALRSAGFKITEWNPGRGERPARDGGRPQVFVALPLLKRGQLDLPREEKVLVEQVRRLVDEGAPVLLTVGRSMLSLLGQPDPWLEVMEPFGLKVEATRIVLELVAREDGTPGVEPWQLIDEPDAGTPLSARLRGRAILFNQPMAVRAADPLPAGVAAQAAVTVAPSPERWLSDDWKGDGDGVREVPAAKRFEAPVPVAMLAERRVAQGDQRVAVVASGGWMLTSVADLSYSLGGGRTALRNPGNRELLLSLASWLAGREDLLDAGLSGREVPRIEGVRGGARAAWIAVFGALLVLGPIVGGGALILARRRAA